MGHCPAQQKCEAQSRIYSPASGLLSSNKSIVQPHYELQDSGRHDRHQAQILSRSTSHAAFRSNESKTNPAGRTPEREKGLVEADSTNCWPSSMHKHRGNRISSPLTEVTQHHRGTTMQNCQANTTGPARPFLVDAVSKGHNGREIYSEQTFRGSTPYRREPLRLGRRLESDKSGAWALRKRETQATYQREGNGSIPAIDRRVRGIRQETSYRAGHRFPSRDLLCLQKSVQILTADALFSSAQATLRCPHRDFLELVCIPSVQNP